jgi:putative heme-binding domain-containing protein
LAEHPFEAGVEGNGVPEKEEIANIALETELLATPVEELAKTALEKGNFKRGKAVFYESAAACFACHDPPRGAARLGPDLATAKTELSHSQLIESLLYPSTLIDKDFAQVKVLTEDGDMKTGIRISENENEIVLRNLVEPEPTKIAKDDIEALKEMKLSLMPENLVRQLKTRQEFDDLMKYIIEVRKK